ncbi:MAG: bifunctional folylpolyglutamate synthase/dihydrofolate synthase [Clostridia bacterium]|nr:bifunctional folylpolyglutamate synthase/dihydrofolate synthase [Clostridia bacterium]
MNYLETLNYIHSLGNFSLPATLDRIKLVLEKLQNPQNSFKAIHIAGTNGKGSVSAMLAKVFQTAGYKTALFISPFIIDFRERIQINGEFISETDLCKYAEKVKATNIALTEFEFITATAFLYFCDKNCDIAIIETGLGGRLDATNALTNVIASVITKIGLDHTQILGDTIEKITAEKCGIIKTAPVITSFNQCEKAMAVLGEYNPIIPDKKSLKLFKSDINGNTYIYKGVQYSTSLVGEYQIENSLIVIETVKNCGINVSDELVKSALCNTYFPARLEVISKKPLVILDGAHNPDGGLALAEFLKQYKGKATAIIGMMKDKDYETVLSLCLPYIYKAVAVTVENTPRTLTADELSKTASKYTECVTADSYDEAIKILENEDVIFVFGSLYLASAIREKIKTYF